MDPAVKCKTTSDIFRWMEEIAECIFETHTEVYQKYVNQFEDQSKNLEGEKLVLHNLRSYVGDEAKK